LSFFTRIKLLFKRRLDEKYDLPDPVYQQWLKIYHPTVAEEIQEKKVQDEPIAYSAQILVEFSPEQEQLFQNTFEHPHFMEWVKTKHSREHEEMNTEHELLGLEHSMNITPCIIAKIKNHQHLEIS